MKTKIELLLRVMIEQLDGIRLIDIVICILLALIITSLYYLVFLRNRIEKKNSFLVFLFAAVLYFEMTVFITIIRRQPGSEYYSGNIVPYIEWGYVGDNKYAVRQVVYNILNVVLFVPVGFFVRGLRRSDNTVKNGVISVMIGFLYSFIIEILQLLSKRGTFELTDIVTNVAGSCLGVIIYEILKRLCGDEKDSKEYID